MFAFALLSGAVVFSNQASTLTVSLPRLAILEGTSTRWARTSDTKTTVVGKIELDGDILRLRAGFGWDGASGPAVDTKDILRASAVHEMKQGLLDSRYKKAVDSEFASILEEDGMPLFRRWYLLKAVSNGSVKSRRTGQKGHEVERLLGDFYKHCRSMPKLVEHGI